MKKIIFSLLVLVFFYTSAHAFGWGNAGWGVSSSSGSSAITDAIDAAVAGAVSDANTYADYLVSSLDNATIARTDRPNTFTEAQTFKQVVARSLRDYNAEPHRFQQDSDFVVNVAMRTSLPTTAHTAEKSPIVFTYSRTGARTFEDYDGIVRTAAENVPRFGGTKYDPITGTHSQIDADGSLLPITPAFEGGVYAVGDSLTAGNTSWTYTLAGLLSQPVDISAALAGGYINKLSPLSAASTDLYERYTAAIDGKHPGVIILQGGFNDINQITESRTIDTIMPLLKANMALMIEDAVGRADSVYVLPIGACGAFASINASKLAAIAVYNAWLRAFCSQNGAVLLDTNSVVESPTTAGNLSNRSNANDMHTVTSDGLHYNTLGSRLIGEYIFSVMQRNYLKGLLLEGTATNIALYSEDFSNEAWNDTNITVAEESTVIAPDGAAGCYSLTATAAGGTLVQDLGDIADTKYIFSAWIKRKTGIGKVYLSLDGGTRLAPVEVDDTWRRVYLNTGNTAPTAQIVYGTIDDPDIAIKLATNGDAVYVWGAQMEASTFPTSYIPTTNEAITKAQDICSFVHSATYLARGNGSIALTAIPLWCSEERYSLYGATDSYIMENSTAYRLLLYATGRNISVTRYTGSGLTATMLTGNAFYASVSGQDIGAVSRGQVCRVGATWTWTTDTSTVLKGFSAQKINTVTDAGTTQPGAYGETMYLNRRQADDTGWFYGYVRDLYMTPTALSDAIMLEKTDIINKD